MDKIINLTDLPKTLDLIKGKNIVLTGGCFDIFHFGHLQFIKNIKKPGEYLIILLESDEFIQKKKNKTAIHNQQQRAQILALMEPIDLIICLPLLNTNSQYDEIVKTIKPQIIAYTQGDSLAAHKDWQAKTIGAQVRIFPGVKGFSCTNIVKYE